MFEIHVTIDCPDLLAAAKLLARHTVSESADAPANTIAAPAPALEMPVTNTPVNTSNPAPTPAPTVPLSQGPTYTMAQIAKAGADLISQNPGLLPQVNALLAQYGVQAVTDIKPEHYGAFATALRGMGVKI